MRRVAVARMPVFDIRPAPPLSPNLRDFPHHDEMQLRPSVEDKILTFQSVITCAVHVPERFRGGCAFGVAYAFAHTISSAKSLDLTLRDLARSHQESTPLSILDCGQ
jgi:hypothetical protein